MNEISLQLAMAAGKRYLLVISVAYLSMTLHRDFEMCRLLVVGADVLSHKSLIWCAVDRAMSPDLVYVVATLTLHGSDLLPLTPGKTD